MPRDRRAAAARSRHDRAVCRAPRARAGGAVRRGAGAVRRRRPGDGRGHRDRRHQGRAPTPAATGRWTTSRSPRRSSRKRSPTDTAETARTVITAVTSCPRPSRPPRAASGWLRAARQRLEQRRAEQAAPIPRSRPPRLLEAKRRLEEELAVERDANERYEAYRARGRDEERPPLRLTAQALHAAGDARRARSTSPTPTRKLGARHARLGAGLQRPSGLQRAAPDPGRRGDDRLTGLRAPRPDVRRRPPRARRRRRHRARPTSCSPTPATGIWIR